MSIQDVSKKVSYTRTMPYHRLCLNLIRIFLLIGASDYRYKNILTLTGPVTSSVTFRQKICNIFRNLKPGLSNAVFGSIIGPVVWRIVQGRNAPPPIGGQVPEYSIGLRNNMVYLTSLSSTYIFFSLSKCVGWAVDSGR